MSFALNRASLIVQALPELLEAEAKLRAEAAKLGITYGIAAFGGVRTQSDTTRILKYRDDDWAVAVRRDPGLAKRTTKEKWRPIAPFGSSFHNYGAAFDLEIISAPPGRSKQWAHDELDKIAPRVGLRTGDSFNDEPHFELPITLAEAKRRWEARGSLRRGTPGQHP